MYATSFDMNLKTLEAIHPKGFQQAYRDVERAFNACGFRRVQQSVYVTERRDPGDVYLEINSLNELSWFSKAVSDIRPFRVEDWSDLTHIFKDKRQ
jgi:virulence-associated protein VapD